MSKLYQDNTHADLIWMEFDGKTWDEFNLLVSDLIEKTRTLEEPYCLIFDPSVDMPRGNPLPHIKRIMRFMENEPKFDHMIAIVPGWMKTAAAFTKVVMQLFKSRISTPLDAVVSSREEALAVFNLYKASKAA